MVEEGSTASTAIFRPRSINCIPKLSINVDFPTPGVPERPILIACPEWLAKAASKSPACSR